jgi:ABC-type Fe3+/spermidine/putrescine transport system ATPase subunit
VLHLSLRGVRFAYPAFTIEATFEVGKGTHVALAGPPASGASTLLRLIAGEVRPQSGEILIGAHVVNTLAAARRPLLFVTSDLDAPGRWSVEHLLVAAVRARSLDREDRKRELDFAVARWGLAALLGRRLDSLSSSEGVLANLARVELLRPAVLLADRLLEHANPAVLPSLADELFRLLRVAGTTVLCAPSSRMELGLMDRVIALEGGRVAHEGTPADVYAAPATEGAAIATGDVNLIPITVRGREVDSVMGGWTVAEAPFEGSGVAVVRPDVFSIAAKGEESDLIFGIEEASFADGRWLLVGMLSGGVMLRVALPGDAEVHKGRLLALRYDPRRFTLLPRQSAAPFGSVPTDVVPPMAETR